METPKLHTTIHDRSGLKLPARSSDDEINGSELMSVARAGAKYLGKWPSRRTAPFNSKWLYRVHREMFGDVWRWAGQRRQSETNIGLPPTQIEEAIENLVQDLAIWDGEIIQDAAELHFQAVRIHPFKDGNGRWARLVTNIWLMQKRRPIVSWPEPQMRQMDSDIRKRYNQAIVARENGNPDLLVELHRRFTGFPTVS